MTHICLSKLIIIAPDNGMLPGWCLAVISTNAGILLIGPLGTNFSEILIEIHTFSLKKIHLKMPSGKWRPFCLSLDVLNSLAIMRDHLEFTHKQLETHGYVISNGTTTALVLKYQASVSTVLTKYSLQ